MIGAADTFRAAAVEQLERWAERAGVELVKGPEGSDPGAVAFDAVARARERGADVCIIDTAGASTRSTTSWRSSPRSAA